jgi:hypothetical protein
MNGSVVHRDERTVLVENASFRLAYLVVSFGLLGLTTYRSFVWRESAWDLIALVVIGGAVPAVYQGYHHVLTSRFAMFAFAAAIIAAVIAAALAWMT